MNFSSLRMFAGSALFLLLSAGLQPALAGEGGLGSLDLTLGLPQLMGANAQVFVTDQIHLGFGYGYFPVNDPLQRAVKLGSFGLGSGYSLAPALSYSMNTLSVFARYFPKSAARAGGPSGGGGFFMQFIYSYWNAGAKVSGSIESGGTTAIPNVLAGSMSLKQHLVGVMMGQEYLISKGSGFFFDIAAGATFKTAVALSADISTNTEAIASTLPAAQRAQLEASIESVKQKVRDSVRDYNKIPVFPLALVAVGVRF